MNYTTRVHRLLRIIAMVQSGRGWGPKALAEELNISERNLYRDLDQLRAAGVPIVFNDDRRCYEIVGRFFMPPVHLDVEESLALAALCEHLTHDEQIPFLRPASRALHKIQSQLPASMRESLAERVQTMAIRTTQTMPPDGYKDVYDTVQEAIAHRRVLRCKYEPVTSERDEQGMFTFKPYALFFAVRAWYAVGQRSDRDSLRKLKLNRFTKITLTDQTYEIPEDFDLENVLGNAWRMIASGPDHEVEIWFDAQFAETISETQWHRTQEIEWHADGSCTFRCTVAGLDEIVWWVLSMGPHCVVRRPGELIERVRTLAQQTMEQYV